MANVTELLDLFLALERNLSGLMTLSIHPQAPEHHPHVHTTPSCHEAGFLREAWHTIPHPHPGTIVA